MSTTPGRKFFDEHMKYIDAKDVDGMIDDQYTEDAVLFSPFDVLDDAKPPHVVRGRAALKAFFQKYLTYQGSINVEELSNFSETESSIFFQAIFTSNTGRWVVGDAWNMRNGQIAIHYGFCHKLG